MLSKRVNDIKKRSLITVLYRALLCYIISKFIVGLIEYSLYVVAAIDCILKMILI